MNSKRLLTGMICGSAFMLGAADFKFGSTLHYYWDEHPIEESMRIMKEGGQNAVRLENSWGNNKRVYDENGNFRLYPRVDEALNLAKEKNITALVLLAGTHPKIKNNFPHGEYLPAWLEYADSVSKLLKGKAPLIQIWNEWDGGHMMSAGKGKINNPENYVELLKQTYPIVKKNCPDSIVMTNSFSTGEAFMYECFKLGMQNYCDAYSVHIYDWNWDIPELMYPGMVRREEMSAKYNNGKPMPFYITEFGWPGNFRTVSDATQADYLSRFMLMARTIKSCKGVMPYNFQDRVEDWTNKEGYWGMQMRDYTPKESFYAMRSVANLITNAEFVKRIDVGNPDVWILEFRKDDGTITVAAWTSKTDVRQQIVLKKEGANGEPVVLERCGNPGINRTWGFLDQTCGFTKGPNQFKPFNPEQFSFQVATRPVLLHNVPEGYTLDYTRTIYQPDPKHFEPITPGAFAVIPAKGGVIELSGARNYFSLLPSDPYRGTDDLSCRTEVRYDVQNLYLKFIVTDNVFHPVAKDERNWDGDSIQLSFSQLKRGQAINSDYTDYMLSLVNGQVSLKRKDNLNAQYTNKTMTKLKIERKGNQTVYDFTVPYSEINVVYEDLQSGSTPIGLTYIINDNDGKGRKGWLNWGEGIGRNREMTMYGWLYFAADSRPCLEVGIPSDPNAWKVRHEGKGTKAAKEFDGSWYCYNLKVKWEKDGDGTVHLINHFDKPIKNFEEMVVTLKNDKRGQLIVRYVDGTGQYFQYRYAIEPSDKIQTVSCRFDNHMFPNKKDLSIWGGAGDKVWHEPLQEISFLVDAQKWSMAEGFKNDKDASLKIGNIQIYTKQK